MKKEQQPPEMEVLNESHTVRTAVSPFSFFDPIVPRKISVPTGVEAQVSVVVALALVFLVGLCSQWIKSRRTGATSLRHLAEESDLSNGGSESEEKDLCSALGSRPTHRDGKPSFGPPDREQVAPEESEGPPDDILPPELPRTSPKKQPQNTLKTLSGRSTSSPRPLERAYQTLSGALCVGSAGECPRRPPGPRRQTSLQPFGDAATSAADPTSRSAYLGGAQQSLLTLELGGEPSQNQTVRIQSISAPSTPAGDHPFPEETTLLLHLKLNPGGHGGEHGVQYSLPGSAPITPSTGNSHVPASAGMPANQAVDIYLDLSQGGPTPQMGVYLQRDSPPGGVHPSLPYFSGDFQQLQLGPGVAGSPVENSLHMSQFVSPGSTPTTPSSDYSGLSRQSSVETTSPDGLPGRYTRQSSLCMQQGSSPPTPLPSPDGNPYDLGFASRAVTAASRRAAAAAKREWTATTQLLGDMLHRALQELADDWEMSSPHFGHCKALFGVLQVFAKQSTEEFFKHCTSLGNPGRRDWLNSQVSAETNLDLAFGILSAYASAFDKEPPQEEPTSTLVDACVFFILRVKSTNAELEEALQDFVSSGTEDSRFLLAERLRDARVWVQEARGMLASPGMGRNSVSVTKLREAVSALGDKCSAASTALGAALQRRS